MKRRYLVAILVFALSFSMMSAVMPREQAHAAIAFLFNKHKPKPMLTTKKATSLYVGGKTIDIDYSIGGKKSGISGTWKSSKPKIIRVDKNGKVKALGNGTAIVSFHYKVGGKKASIKCKIVGKTRAAQIELLPQDDFDGNVLNGKLHLFKSKLTPIQKALNLNPNITSTYKPYYELFVDEACTVPAPISIATVTDSGLLIAKQESGKVYLRAVGKDSKKSKTFLVYSKPIEIFIGNRLSLSDAKIEQKALNQFTVSYEEAEKIIGIEVKDKNQAVIPSKMVLSEDLKTITVTASKNLIGIHTVSLSTSEKTEKKEVTFEDQKVKEIQFSGSEAPLVSFDGTKGVAAIGYKLLDQFGNDVTTDFRFVNKSFATWENSVRITPSEDARILIPLKAEQLFDFVGTLEFTYGGEEVVKKAEKIKIGKPSTIKEIQVKGIYKRTAEGYSKVLDSSLNLPVGTVINHFGGVSNFTQVPDSYFLLVGVKDSNGNSISMTGTDASKFLVTIASDTGIALDTADGKTTIQSISPITVDGESYLTYPLKPAVLKAGNVTVNVSAVGTNIVGSMVAKVAEAAGIRTFRISGEGKIGVESLINFILYNANNEHITKYEEVLATLGLNDYGVGSIFIPFDSKIISSANSSVFIFKKNKTTGLAELYYNPNILSLPNGMSENKEEIIVMKGTNYQETFLITVKTK